ncbi:MAG: glycoside hydrolase domain-containing protein [Candidatus Berkelbacteria bacterium]
MGNKRKTTVLILVVVFIAILAGVFYLLNQKFHFLADTNSSIELYGVSPNEKLIKGMSLTENKNNYAVTIAKNEYEPLVVAVKNTSGTDSNVKLTMPTLTGYKFEFYHVEYVDFGYEGLYQRETTPEFYADPLVPIASGGEITVPQNSEEFVWVNVFAEKSATAGNKQASIDFGQGGNFNIKINQMDVTLPDKSTLSNIINLEPRYAFLAHGYDSASPEEKTSLINKYVDDFSAHRISPTLYSGSNLTNLTPTEQVYWDFDANAADPGLTVDFSHLNIDKIKNSSFRPYNIASYMYGKSSKALTISNKPETGVSTSITCSDDSSCSKFDLAVKEYFAAWNQYLTDNGMIDDSIYYIGDELDTTSTDYNKVQHLASLVHQSAPKLKIAVTIVTGDISVLKPIVDKLTDVDIWIPHLSSVLYADPTNWLPAGDELWVYDTSTSSRADAVPEQSRLMPWMAYKYGAVGNLSWASNSYIYSAPWYPKYIYPYGTNYLYYSPAEDKNWTGVSIVNGALVYNNASIKDPTLVKSIRLEMIREGAEDYELIKMLEAKSSTTPEAQSLLDKIKAVPNLLKYGNIYSYKVDKLLADGKLSPNNWQVALCDSSANKKCMYANREVSEPLPGIGLTESGAATINLDNIIPGSYKMTLEVGTYTSKWDVTAEKPVGSKFTLKINDGDVKNYDYYAQFGASSPGWLINYLSQASMKNSSRGLREIKPVLVGADGKLTLEFGTVEEARAALYSLQLNQISEDYGTASLMSQVKTALNPVEIKISLIDSINLSDNQVITTNPYIISLKLKDPADTIKVSKVEFFVDNTLISTSTLPDVSGTFQAVWDTSKYHSAVKVILYNTDGTTQEVTRNTTVNLSQDYQSPIVNVLPQTGEGSIWSNLLSHLRLLFWQVD